jgi:hypothetical protein
VSDESRSEKGARQDSQGADGSRTPKRKSLRTIYLPNSSPVPNWFFDSVLSDQKISHATRSVLLYLLRRTIGWDNAEEELSLSQIEHGAAVSLLARAEDECETDDETVTFAEQVILAFLESFQR